jgi:hypothetical protein
MFKKAAFILAMPFSAANAETMTCPVGGERFDMPIAAECNDVTGATMLLMPLGCPPKPLPQCPQNFLPVYKVFTDAEFPELKQYMQTESYESNVDFSPYFLSYNIEKFLNGSDGRLPARLLLEGLWQDPALIFSDPAYLSAFNREIDALVEPDSANNNSMLLSMQAFIELLKGNVSAGRAYLEQSENQNPDSPRALVYLQAVRACFSDPSQRHCNATAAIPEP